MRIWKVKCILIENSNYMIMAWGKGFLSMRNNSPSHINDKTTKFIKNIKLKECKI